MDLRLRHPYDDLTAFTMQALEYPLELFELVGSSLFLAEAGEPNLSRRLDMLLATYGAKISSFQYHPSRKALLYPKLRSAYVLRPSLPNPPGKRLRRLPREMNLEMNLELPSPLKPSNRYIAP